MSEGRLQDAEARGPDNGEVLSCRDLRIHFDGVKAVDGVDLDLHPGEILGLIGPNGAGKTTLVNALTGFQRPSSGELLLDGRCVTRWPAHRLAHHGVSRTFQSGRLFHHLTTLENVEVAAGGRRISRRRAREHASELLELMGLTDRAHLPAESLSYGEQRHAEIARALARRPRYTLLDEPAAGLNDQESEALVGRLEALPRTLGCGVLLIEHDMRVIMRLCQRIQVLNYGQTICVGTPEEVRSDPAVVAAYLGDEVD